MISFLDFRPRWVLLLSAIWIAAAASASAQGMSDPVLTQNPSGRAPLTATLTFSTDAPARSKVFIDDGRRVRAVDASTGYATQHEAWLIGLRPGRTHTLTVLTVDQSGNEARSAQIQLDTPDLPDDFPRLTTAVSKPEAMEPGVTLFNVFSQHGNSLPDVAFLIAVDERGEVVWHYRPEHSAGDVHLLPSGNLLYTSEVNGRRAGLAEIDLLGNVVRRWHGTTLAGNAPEGSTAVETESFHHAVDIMPSGNILALSTDVRFYDDYRSSDRDPNAARERRAVIGDVIAEVTHGGAVVRDWKLLDILDPRRISLGSLSGGFWRGTYAGVVEGRLSDWAHTNAIDYNPTDHSAIVSMHNQDAVVKIDLATGKPVWILGAHGGWEEPWQPYLLEPVGELRWPYHQHAARLTTGGTILMYDNGNAGALAFERRTPASEIYSRAVEYVVDEEAMTVRQVWSYGGPKDEVFFSSYLSDADLLIGTGNVLIADGARTGPERGRNWARIVEVTHDSPAEKVFELIVDDEPPKGWRIYRAQRLPSLYR